MKLRPAKKEDIAFIRAIEMDPDYSSFISLDTEESHLAQVQDDYISLNIYEEKEEAIGFLLGVYDPKLKIYELRRLALKERGRGLGKKALALAFKDAFEGFGAQRLWLDVYEYNTRAIGLYRTMGMTHEAILRSSDIKNNVYVNQWIFGILKKEYEMGLEKYKHL